MTVEDFEKEFGEQNVSDNCDGTVTVRRVYDGGIKSFGRFEVSEEGFKDAQNNENYD